MSETTGLQKTAAIHQPNFLPWVGYFYKISHADVFVFLDDVQFARRGFTHRNKIKTPGGEQWITLPIIQKGKYTQNINECFIQDKDHSIEKITRSITANYKRSPYYDWLIDDLERELKKNTDSLSELNMNLVRMILEKLDIKTEIKVSSELPGITGQSTDRLISICKSVNADRYFFGFGGKNYQEEELFNEAQITTKLTDFSHPLYSQQWGDFIPNLSIIDYLFNVGPDSKLFFQKT